jgi:hypothetical protein
MDENVEGESKSFRKKTYKIKSERGRQKEAESNIVKGETD